MSCAVKIRNTVIEKEGKPKICVPVTGRTYEEIIEAMKNIKNNYEEVVDLIELRVDFYEDVMKEQKLLELLKEVRNTVGEIPVLFTFRTKEEGGEKEINVSDYERLLMLVTKNGMADAVDVEVMRDIKMFEKVVECAKKNNIKVIASYHDFGKTPEKEEILDKLILMEKYGADIVKIAVMPNKDRDVVILLSALCEAKNKVKAPVVAISMGKLGGVSRVAGETFGSAITFGIAKEASAPGQLEAKQLRKVLDILH